jgi:DNA-binding CsgD family transcriptional regulator
MSNLSPLSDLHGLEEAIFEAALAPEKWPVVLELVSRNLGSCGGMLVSLSGDCESWTSSADIHTLMERVVREGWLPRDSRLRRSLDGQHALSSRFVTEMDFFCQGEMDQDPLFTEFLWPNGLGHSAWMMVDLGLGHIIFFRFERELREGPFPRGALERFNRLWPHLRRAAIVGMALSQERDRAGVRAFSSIGFAAAALAADGQILDSNPEFTAEDTPWHPIRSGRLSVSDPAADDALYKALGSLGELEGALSIPLRIAGEHVRAVLHLLPGPRGLEDVFAGAAAIAVLSTSATGKRPSAPLLRSLFELTPAEADIASRIAAGESVEEMARTYAKSAFTIRNQIKSILAKTGCRRQQDLVRLISELLPPRDMH